MLRFRRELDTLIEWENGPSTNLMAQTAQVRAGGSWRIDIDQAFCAVCEEPGLTMWRFDYSGIEDGRILTVRQKQGTIVQADRPAGHHKGIVGGLHHGSGSGSP